MTSIKELEEMMKEFSEEFSQLLQENKFDEALDVSLPVLKKLIDIAKNDIVENIRDPTVKKISEEIINGYENTLAYVEGILEGLKLVSPIYSLGEKERLIQVVASSINELFSFIMGALIIVADLTAALSKQGDSSPPGVV